MDTNNTIVTTAPISINDLKKYFSNKELKYLVDYENSSLKGMKLLTYLSNLDLPCDIIIPTDNAEKMELLKAYFECPFIVNVPALESIALMVLLEHKGLTVEAEYRQFIDDNKDIVKHWSDVLDSLTVYNMYIIEAPELKEWAQSLPHDDTTSMEGVNFVNVLKHSAFYGTFYDKIDQSSLKFYDLYFTSNVFKGAGLYDYWANENNPLFLLTYGIAEGMITADTFSDMLRDESLGEDSATSI